MRSGEPKNYYRTLGLARDATPEDIKHVYRELARELHPDVNPDKAAQEKFKAIAIAYEILNDPVKRRAHDRELGLNPETSASTADRMKAFLRTGGTPTCEMLMDALCNDGYADMETVKVLLQAGVVPDEAALAYAVQKLSAYVVATLVRYGGEPTPAMLQDAVVRRHEYIAKVLIDHGVPATEEARRLVSILDRPGIDRAPSLKELSATFGDSVKMVENTFKSGRSLWRNIVATAKARQP